MVDCWKRSSSHLPVKLSEHVLPLVSNVTTPAISDPAGMNEARGPKSDFDQDPDILPPRGLRSKRAAVALMARNVTGAERDLIF